MIKKLLMTLFLCLLLCFNTWAQDWDIWHEVCDNLNAWTNNDGGDGQTLIDPAGQFKFNSFTAGPTHYARQYQDFGSFPDTSCLEFKIKHDALGTIANGDNVWIQIRQDDERLGLKLGTDGFFIRDDDVGGDWTEVGTNLVKFNGSAEFQIWRLNITYGVAGAGTCNVYLQDTTYPDWEKVGTAIPCSFENAGTDGVIYIAQYGNTSANRIMHLDYIRMDSDHFDPTPSVTAAQVIFIN